MSSDISVTNENAAAAIDKDSTLQLEATSSANSKNRLVRRKVNGKPVVQIDVAEIRGMPIHSISLMETVSLVLDSSRAGRGGWVVTPNLDILRRYRKSISFRNLVATSTLNVADGMPIVWASRILGMPVPERINGTDLMVEVCRAASVSGETVYFLGGAPGTAVDTAEELTARFPGLNVSGCDCPEYGFESDMDSINKIADEIRTNQPDIVFIGLGSPKQDVLINMLRLQFPNIWWLGVGVSFSFISGDIARAPNWAKASGFEWLYRLVAEPRRLAKRYLVEGIPFFATTLLVCFTARVFGKAKRRTIELEI